MIFLPYARRSSPGVTDERITWSVSMSRTDFVLRPNEASSSIPRSRASCTTRLMGAESGLTTARMRAAATALPKPIEISFMSASGYSMFCACSRIFSSSALRSTTVRACSMIVALGADGVGLAVELLQQEIQLAADRAAGRQHLVQLVQVAAQADRLFVHGDLVGVDGGLLQNAALVDIRLRRAPPAFFRSAGRDTPQASRGCAPRPFPQAPERSSRGCGDPASMAAPSFSRMALNLASASLTTDRISSVSFCSSSSCFSITKTSGMRDRAVTEMSSRTP